MSRETFLIAILQVLLPKLQQSINCSWEIQIIVNFDKLKIDIKKDTFITSLPDTVCRFSCLSTSGVCSWLIGPTSMVKHLVWHGSPVQGKTEPWGWCLTVLSSLPSHCQVTFYLLSSACISKRVSALCTHNVTFSAASWEGCLHLKGRLHRCLWNCSQSSRVQFVIPSKISHLFLTWGWIWVNLWLKLV